MSKLAPGRYRAKILYHTITENSANHPELRMAVLPHADTALPLPPTYKPTPLTIFMTITDATIGTPDAPGWVTQTLRHLGFTSADLTLLDPDGEAPFSFTGLDITILGSEDEYKGKKRTRWNILRNATESKPIASAKLKALSIRYQKTLETLLQPPAPSEDPTEFDPKKLETGDTQNNAYRR